MNSSWELIRDYMRNINFIRHMYKILTGFAGFMYDYKRFLAYGGWQENMNDIERRNYQQVYCYHRLEKSLSFKERNPNSGWRDVYELLNLLNIAKQSNSIGYHDKASKQILEKFIALPENINLEQSQSIKKELEKFDFNSNDIHGAMEYNLSHFKKGKLEQPEDFFLTRYSLREFQDKTVGDEIIHRAIRLAMKTPSVCNRQAWHIYHTSDKEVKNSVLRYQNGNRHFGENIPNLLVITTDLKAFFSATERYQHWIDGGLLSMSLMYAFHALGMATCALNWSQSPKNDKLLRKIVNIKPDHTIIMLLAVGYPDENNKVCLSARRPFEEIYSTLENR
ncbi:nitroreductase [Thioploca ingrica]|uniref:Nitroreductase n=1 Tax=Thioploca ingrica TaxID=40754 RepID=A0A090AK13_9GAMM|nr:nitroreductase [Thioploca ingrica]